MPQYVAAIDQGTTSTRFMIFDHDGAVVAMDQKEHRQIFPQPGWVEHDPLEIWERTKEVIRTALTRGKVPPGEIAAIGIANQRETTVVWERATGKPIGNAIVWQDTRTDDICRGLAAAGGQDRLRPTTGLPLATYFSGPKIQWILENTPGARLRAERGELLFGNIDSWLIWNLTGGLHVTDPTNASRTMLMNLKTLDWDEENLKLFGIPRSMLPQIRSSAEVYGRVAEIPGLPLAGVPVAGDLGDQQAALFGQTCFRPGEAKNTYGTGCFMLMNTGSRPVASAAGLLTTVGYRIGGEPAIYALEGSIAVTGALVQWLRDNLGLIASSGEVEELARGVGDSGGIYIVPAFSGLFAPYWRMDARGAIVGLTRFINKGHLARAALEATAYQARDVVVAMEQDSGVRLQALKVDGGMVRNELLMQFQADILQVPVIRPKISETTALGAAYAAGLAVGVWQSPDELRGHWGMDRTWKPQMPVEQAERLYAGWKKAVTRTFDWVEG